MLPREFGLASNVFGETISIYREAGCSRSHKPAQIRLSLDGIAIAADLARNTDIVNRMRHRDVCSLCSSRVSRRGRGTSIREILDSRQGGRASCMSAHAL